MRKRYSSDFKVRVVMEVLKEEKTLSQVASENGIHPNQISNWKAQFLSGLPTIFEKDVSGTSACKAEHEKQLNELYTEIGKLTTQLAWLKKKAGIDL